MSETLYESRQKNLPSVIIAGYFTLFAVIYFTGFDAAPSTGYFWRFFLFLISMGTAILAFNKWRSYWPVIGLAILFLMLIEFVITMTATYDFLLWHQVPHPFYIVGLKIRAVWFFIHTLAVCVWYWGKPRKNALYRLHQNSDKIQT